MNVRAVVRAARAPAVALVVFVALGLLGRAVVPRWQDQLALGAAAPGDPPGAVVREGTIRLPRPGKYVFGVQSPGPARLTVGGQVIGGAPDAHGVTTAGIILEADEAPVRLAGPADARLVWHPPGRRGAPEYVPAANLRPPSETGAWPDAIGTSRVAGLVGLAMLAVVVALAGHYLRPRWRATPRAVRHAALAVLVVALVVRLTTLGDAGQTWDEDENWSAGRNYVANVVTLDGSPAAWVWNLEHPPVMKYLVGVGAQFADGFGPSRATAALLVALACGLVVLVGARLYTPRVGLIAGVVAALTPHLIAHGQVVGHEAPTVLWWSLGVWLALGTFDGLAPLPDGDARRRLLARLAGLGVVLGVAVASRFVNALAAPLLGAIVLVQAPTAWRRRVIGYGLAIMPVVAVATVVVLWPRLWHDPLAHLAESWARLSKPHGSEPWLGGMTNQPSPLYFLVYLVVTAPVGLLLLAGAWKLRTAAALRRRDTAEGKAALVLVLWWLAPLGVMLSPVRQDGVRYVLPCLLAMSVMAAAGLDAVGARMRHRRAPAVALGVLVLYLGVTCARIQPYYLDYYGEAVGGPAGVQARRWMETAWWGEGLDRAIAYVNAHAEPGARVHRGCVEPGHLTWFRGDLWTPMVERAREATWIVTYAPKTRPCTLPADATRVFVVEAQGAVLAEVWRREGGAAAR
ncbi:MAG: glycosyltransferase family 39 protein [Kofleriaceae bacterium]